MKQLIQFLKRLARRRPQSSAATMKTPRPAIPPGPATVTIEGRPCRCVHCQHAMLSLVTQLSYLPVWRRWLKRQATIHPVISPEMASHRLERRVVGEAANYSNN